jgi:hypothetical protein
MSVLFAATYPERTSGADLIWQHCQGRVGFRLSVGGETRREVGGMA